MDTGTLFLELARLFYNAATVFVVLTVIFRKNQFFRGMTIVFGTMTALLYVLVHVSQMQGEYDWVRMLLMAVIAYYFFPRNCALRRFKTGRRMVVQKIGGDESGLKCFRRPTLRERWLRKRGQGAPTIYRVQREAEEEGGMWRVFFCDDDLGHSYEALVDRKGLAQLV